MGYGRGTGSPLQFQCPKWRHNRTRYGTPGPRHQVELTGRWRRTSASRGLRSTDTVREYRCLSCGHTGWSNHVDLERMQQSRR